MEPGFGVKLVEWFRNGDGEDFAGLLLWLLPTGRGAGSSRGIRAASFLVGFPICLLAFSRAVIGDLAFGTEFQSNAVLGFCFRAGGATRLFC